MQVKKLAAGLAGAVALGVLAFSAAPANAQVPYIGVDFGGGFGVGIGVPPSAWGWAPASPLYPVWGAPARYYPPIYPYPYVW
jgi:hypothetical protein